MDDRCHTGEAGGRGLMLGLGRALGETVVVLTSCVSRVAGDLVAVRRRLGRSFQDRLRCFRIQRTAADRSLQTLAGFALSALTFLVNAGRSRNRRREGQRVSPTLIEALDQPVKPVVFRPLTPRRRIKQRRDNVFSPRSWSLILLVWLLWGGDCLGLVCRHPIGQDPLPRGVPPEQFAGGVSRPVRARWQAGWLPRWSKLGLMTAVYL